MSLKQLDDLKRILFLNYFVLQLIIESTKDEKIKKLIEIEKIKKKLNLEKVENKKIDEIRPEKNITPRQIIKPIVKPTIKTIIKPKVLPMIQSKAITPQPVIIPQTREIEQRLVQESIVNGIEKIESLIRDQNIQSIECPGQGKNLLVMFRNKINITKITLTEEDIKKIVEYFSNNAKIPVIGGVLKAAVGLLVISAVVSEYSGSKFIINKKSPYEIINV